MLILIYIHVITGLIGIATGMACIGGMFYRRRMSFLNAVFLMATAISCATGFVFLPIYGITSAQWVAFFLMFLLALAVHARYRRRLGGHWNQIYALTAVGSLFLNLLIATAQSFLHIHALKILAPTQESPVYIMVKFMMLAVFILLAVAAVRRAGGS